MDTPKDKRVKREIANSNERRRMQSINAGFQKLKRLLPVNDGEKLSKASILQHAADFIQQIQRDKLILHDQNTLIRGIIMDYKNGRDISTAINNIDSLPTIPIGPSINNNTSNNNNNSASNNNNTTDSNSSSINSNNNDGNDAITTNRTTTTAANTTDTTSSTTTTTTTTLTTGGSNTNSIINKTNDSSHNNTSSDKNNKNNTSKNTTTTTIRNEDPSTVVAADIISDRIAAVSPKNGMVSVGVAKAAIALPLEVPYISETAIRVEHHHHHHLHHNLDSVTTNARKILKTDLATTTIDPQDPPATKGQNLDTICKAIMEIEGDRVFTNENLKHEQGTT